MSTAQLIRPPRIRIAPLKRPRAPRGGQIASTEKQKLRKQFNTELGATITSQKFSFRFSEQCALTRAIPPR
jgi:hypothetical protein